MSDRSGLRWVKVRRFLALFVQPEKRGTWFAVDRLEDIPIDRLILEGIRGVLVDVDGTLGPHRARHFPDSAVRHVLRMKESGLQVALYTNDREDRFEQLPGVPVATGVPPKPDPEGFRLAMNRFLKLDNPRQVCMVGDNYITDGGAVEAGMRFIHVEPLPGGENPVHRLTRWIARYLARRSMEFQENSANN